MRHPVLHKAGPLARLILRRDRVRLPVWIVSFTAITLIVANAFTGLYATETERQTIAETMRNPAMTAMVGKGYGLDNYTFGAMMAHQMLLMTALVVGIMSILLVVRHTREDEEDGLIEMVRSLPVGRLSTLHATLLVQFAAQTVMALIIGFGLYSLGIESMDLEGSLLYGAALGATGMIFASIAALFAQLSESSRRAMGLSITVLIAAYLIRAIGDVSNEAFSWLSPLAWVSSSEVYVNNHWWPIVLTVGVALGLGAAAYYLNAIRDLGSGLLPSKPGRRHASVFLQGPFGLAWRLQRTGLLSWAAGMYVLGASYGSVLGDLDSFIANNEMMKEMFASLEGYSLTEQFITMIMSVISMLCTVPPMLAVLKLKGEERKNRSEHLLSRAVSRSRLLGSYLGLSLLTGLAVLSLAAVGLGSVGIAVMEDGMAFGTFYQAALVYLPAMWVMIGLSTLLIGLAPRFTGFVWLYLGYSFLVVYLGKLLQFPEWMARLSPFGNISRIPVEDWDIGRSLLLIAIAAAATLAGFAGYRKRDLEG